jgi:hypothetical protein
MAQAGGRMPFRMKILHRGFRPVAKSFFVEVDRIRSEESELIKGSDKGEKSLQYI